jgi:hypothetical protein
MAEEGRGPFASASVPRHLLRGAIGFGLLGGALGGIPVIGPAAFLFAPLGFLALRGCPMCWGAGLIETIPGARVKPSCTLRSPDRLGNGELR